MVIQPNMSPESIVNTWEQTREIFEKRNIPITNVLLQDSIQADRLLKLLKELNTCIGSSDSTCIEGG